MKNNLIIGRKGSIDLIISSPSIVELVYIAENAKLDPELSDLLKTMSVSRVKSSHLDEMADGVNHQGVICKIHSRDPYNLKQLIEVAKTSRGLLLAIDQIQDPHNLGAVLRVADAMGVDGLIKTERHCASESSPTVIKTSCGASHFVPVCTVPNLAASITTLKKEGFWIVGSCLESNSIEISKLDANRPIVLVLGGEGKGMRRQTIDLCDYLVNIPMLGKLKSLNVSTAASVLLYEINRLTKLN